ncbi:MAG: DUF3368 domain-containing protein [Leptolyngbyaceae cyanobacterium SM1_4_3]|nr:DUF3368 domain-containing protein [Leptolyngbyaceae cyanobacterium SM1_4_3]NJN90087.1 DUF3368 domain-containing protein [Leptolyngbyaceae cyanobacterium SL_5_14]
MVVVSDTSPITSLAAIAQLDLLRQLYQKVIIPQAVYDEMASLSKAVPGTIEVQTSAWIETRQAENRVLVARLQEELDIGESEAIALAIEIKADRLLIDEAPGRTIAAQLELKFTGVLGVLLAAKHKGIISLVKPVMDDLIVRSSFRVSNQVYMEILKIAGE